MPQPTAECLIRNNDAEREVVIHAGLATAHAERAVAGARTIEVARVRITEAGRRVLAEGNNIARMPNVD